MHIQFVSLTKGVVTNPARNAFLQLHNLRWSFERLTLTLPYPVAGDFVVDDGIEGYQDIGEEEDWTAGPEPEAEEPVKGSQKAAGRKDGQKGHASCSSTLQLICF